MTRILAIDPGSTESAYAVIESTDCRVIWAEKLDNHDLYQRLTEESTHYYEDAAIEMVASHDIRWAPVKGRPGVNRYWLEVAS